MKDIENEGINKAIDLNFRFKEGGIEKAGWQ